MHEPIRDRLEDLLRPAAHGQPPAIEHLSDCPECSEELEVMQRQAKQFALLRAPNIEPEAGFYARVLQRIEERESCSFWTFFAESPLSRGLAVASLAISIALGTYMVSQERAERHQSAFGVLAADGRPHYDATVTGSQEEQRDAVLVNFEEHSAAATPQGAIR